MKYGKTYRAEIFIGGDLSQAQQICREWCMEVGGCVTVTPTEFVFTGGQESGVRVGFINYLRFPSDPSEIFSKAKELAEKLRVGLCQKSYSIVADDKTTWYPKELDQEQVTTDIITTQADAPKILHVKEGVAIKDGLVTKVRIEHNPVSSRGEECFGPLYVLSSYHNEMIAAAYHDAADGLYPSHFAPKGEYSTEAGERYTDVSMSIFKRTPENAQAALDAYGVRMKAEGAKEERRKWQNSTQDAYTAIEKAYEDHTKAQAKIAKLTAAMAIAGPIALKDFDVYPFILNEDERRKVETINTALQESVDV